MLGFIQAIVCVSMNTSLDLPLQIIFYISLFKKASDVTVLVDHVRCRKGLLSSFPNVVVSDCGVSENDGEVRWKADSCCI